MDILAEEPNIPNGWNQSPLEMSDTKFDDIGRGEDVVSYKDDFKFLIGVILSYNQTSRIIESLQFIKMTNENNIIIRRYIWKTNYHNSTN